MTLCRHPSTFRVTPRPKRAAKWHRDEQGLECPELLESTTQPRWGQGTRLRPHQSDAASPSIKHAKKPGAPFLPGLKKGGGRGRGSSASAARRLRAAHLSWSISSGYPPPSRHTLPYHRQCPVPRAGLFLPTGLGLTKGRPREPLASDTIGHCRPSARARRAAIDRRPARGRADSLRRTRMAR
jgi:hypothetical protein